MRRTTILLLATLFLATGAFAQQPRPVTPRGPLDAQEQNNIAVFRKVSPSVVHITTLAQQRDFFSRNVTEVPSGTGSGFLWDERGHIVTNFHVIRGASAAKVTLSDQTAYDATLVGVDPDRDLAVLRIAAPREKLQPVPMGSSRELQVGLRPEHMTIAETGAPSLDALVDWVEALGADTIAHMRLADGAGLDVRLPGTTSVRAGDRLRLAAAPAHIHLFAAESGKRA